MAGAWELLGDVVAGLIDIAFPVQQRVPFPVGPHFYPLKVCLVGPPFSGKTTVEKSLESKFGLKFFDVKKVNEDRLKLLELKTELEEGKKHKKQGEEESEMFTEECLGWTEDLGMTRLLRAKLRGLLGDQPKQEEEGKKTGKKEDVKCQGWGVVAYPNTVLEAKELEWELAGFVPEEDLPESQASVKQKEAALVAPPSTSEAKPKPLELSVFDLVC